MADDVVSAEVRLVLTIGGGWKLTDERREPIEHLAEKLRSDGLEVSIVPPEPMRGVGLIFGELVLVYVVMKTVDNLTNRALDALIDRLTEPIKKWARDRVQERLDAKNARIRGTTVVVMDEEGRQIGPTIRVTAEPEGEPQVDVLPPPSEGEPLVRRPMPRPEEGDRPACT